MSQYIEYEKYKPSPATAELLELADKILGDYAAQGLTLTVRQLYYQFVARGAIENSQRSYNRVKAAITKGRMGGLIAWDHIEDRGRVHHQHLSYYDIADHLTRAAEYHALDWWEGQPNVAEVWVEKQALEGVISRAADRRQTEYFACKGYPSASSSWRAAQRILERYDDGQTTTIIHLGDHDPSGVDMTRDIEDRLRIFGCHQDMLDVNRIALTMAQVREVDPPPNPAKMTDSRTPQYIARFNTRSSWELDALDPDYLDNIIIDAIDDAVLEPEAMAAVREEEKVQQERMRQLAGQEARH